MQQEIEKNLSHNFLVNILDGGFFGAAMGFASRVAVLPLFVASMTDSTLIIGLIFSLLEVGWQLPQVLTSGYVAGLRRYKRVALLMSLNERLPFIGLAIVAAMLPVLGPQVTLIFTLLLLTWQALGGGLTATAWQSLIGKIMPANRRGTFYGMQSSAAALLTSIAVIAAGYILLNVPAPMNYALCFALASVFMGVSFYFLAITREPEGPVVEHKQEGLRAMYRRLRGILARDVNVRWFIIARVLAAFAVMSVAFYSIYAVRRFGLDEGTIGVMAGMLTLAQMVAAPLLGRLGDHWGHRRTLALGMGSALLGALTAAIAPTANWLYFSFALAGVANAVLWSTVLAYTCEFGTLEERPHYIGLTNTLVAPATLAAPLIGATLVDTFGFSTMFLVATAFGIACIAVLLFVLRDPAGSVRPIAAIAVAGD